MYFSLNNPDFSISKYFLLEDIASLLNIDTSIIEHFSDFVFTNSSDMIIEISKKFLTLEKGIGYIYDLFNAPFKVEHPIIEKIKSGKKPIEILIPKGSADKNFWIPDSLKK